MDPELSALKQTLTEGLKASQQGSYERRAPSAKARPHLEKACLGLMNYVKSQRRNAEAWRLLSLAQESLLNYSSAHRSLQRAMSLSPKRLKKDLKRMALLGQYAKKWKELLLTPEELETLGCFLRRQLQASPCEHNLASTTDWLRQYTTYPVESVLSAFEDNCAFCDCEILNVVDG